MNFTRLGARILRRLNQHRTTELYFVGYPKTGNTWLRYMLGRYVQVVCELPEMPLFDATDRWGRCEKYCVGRTMQFTHRPLLWDRQRASDLVVDNTIRPFANKYIVLLIRHPLDTMVSLWMQRLYRGKRGYTGSLADTLVDPVWGIEKLFRFYTLWDESHKQVKDLMVLRYEDMRANPQAAFGDLLQYLSIPFNAAAADRAVADADFDSMRQVELSGAVPRFESSGLSIFATGNTNNADALHVRRGKVGGYRDYLSPDEVTQLSALILERLPASFGYGDQGRGG